MTYDSGWWSIGSINGFVCLLSVTVFGNGDGFLSVVRNEVSRVLIFVKSGFCDIIIGVSFGPVAQLVRARAS